MRPALLLLLAPGCLFISEEELAFRTSDATVDTGEPCLITWYADVDGDGYGDRSSALVQCAQPSGYVDNRDDCDDNDDAVVLGATFYADADGDGYGNPDITVVACTVPAGSVDNAGDCDDSNASAWQPSTWYLDADGDGFGSDETTSHCGQPSGYADNAGDCDDDDGAVNPDQVETCETEADDDCSGDANEDGSAGCDDYYYDGDADGYGVGDSVCACAPADGYTAVDDGDCDDAAVGVNPGAFEVCNDGLDNDCDGGLGSCELGGVYDSAGVDAVLNGVAGSDWAGYAVSIVGDVDGDGVDDVAVGAHSWDGGGYNSGGVFVLPGPVSGTVGLADAPMATLNGDTTGDRAGWVVAPAGDLDGDGYDDFLTGAVYQDDGGTNAGAAYLVFGPLSGTNALQDVSVRYVGTRPNHRTGSTLGPAGDINGDGHLDVLIGAPYEDSLETNGGASFLVLGPLSTGVSDGWVSRAELKVTGDGPERLGTSQVGVGDMDGDGLDDFVVSADRSDLGATDGGAVYAVFGDLAGTVAITDAADGVRYGDSANAYAGGAVSPAGDANDDGFADVFVGAPGASSGKGAAYLVLGPMSGSRQLTGSQATVLGVSYGDDVGLAVSAGGDFNRDGWSDLLVGGPGSSGGSGGAWLYYGPMTGAQDTSTADVTVQGDSGSSAGTSVSLGGDLNGDGTDDLLVGAPEANAGAAYVLFGGGL